MNLFTKRKIGATSRMWELLSENLPRPIRKSALQPATTLRELGINSMGLILVIARFCEEFDIPPESLQGNLGDFRTVDDLLSAGERILESRDAQASNPGANHG